MLDKNVKSHQTVDKIQLEMVQIAKKTHFSVAGLYG